MAWVYGLVSNSALWQPEYDVRQPYVNAPCSQCTGTDRVLPNWAYRNNDYPYALCITCRRRIAAEQGHP
jgi:hypothetical protein